MEKTCTLPRRLSSQTILLLMTSSLLALHFASTGCHACREPQEVLSLRLRETHANSNDNSVVSMSLSSASCPTGALPVCDCPTQKIANLDENRIPKVIIETSCCHRNWYVIENSNFGAFCKNVTHNVQVFRRTHCHNGEYRYRLEWEQVPVGCSCSTVHI